SLNIPGFYVISGRKPDTEITNYPPGVSLNSAGAMYAQIIVYKNASSGMILQHFLDNISGNMYMRKYYSNSWSIWKK
ncbi:pyocin knob domain-containing protein, partial [Lactococcus garvieae]